jgi:hypothetical protein
MRHRLTFIAIAMALAPVSVPPAPIDATASKPVIVHEWGTFTSIAGEDGRAVEWTPQAGPQDLPSFVERLRSNIKGWMPGTIRMETPVLYFYAPRDMTVSVSVRFRQGIVTEWFPRATVTPTSVASTIPRSAAFESSITWPDVKVTPGAVPDFLEEERPNHYYAARNTDASPLQSGTEKERFLFYRGIGRFDPPLNAHVDRDGNVVVVNPGGEAVGDVILFENRGGATAYQMRHSPASRTAFQPLTLERGSHALFRDFERTLMAHGLYPMEAAAMIDTWRDSWFEEGTRVFYIVSRGDVDAIVPLEVTPAPAAIERVFVGRIELATLRVLARAASR